MKLLASLTVLWFSSVDQLKGLCGIIKYIDAIGFIKGHRVGGLFFKADYFASQKLEFYISEIMKHINQKYSKILFYT